MDLILTAFALVQFANDCPLALFDTFTFLRLEEDSAGVSGRNHWLDVFLFSAQFQRLLALFFGL